MYYPEELIEEVRQRNDIVDVISGYVGLQKKGSNYMCCCPFHGEKTPSFSVNRARQIYKCFGCGEGGNVLTFVMKYENCTFLEAMKILAQKAGVVLPEAEYSEEAKKRESRRQRLLAVNKKRQSFIFISFDLTEESRQKNIWTSAVFPMRRRKILDLALRLSEVGSCWFISTKRDLQMI